MTATASPKVSVPLDIKLTAVQNRLFEQAHSEPMELKFLAIALSNQGIVGDALFANPHIMPMPMQRCEYLKSLSPRQIAILTACYFANFYKLIVNSESQTLISNMASAEKSFEPFSDEYMILHQETNEEMDHIWTFRTVYEMVCRETTSVAPLEAPGFFRGMIGFMPKADFEAMDIEFNMTDEFEHVLSLLLEPGGLQKLLAEMKTKDRGYRYRILHFLMGDAPRQLSASEVQALGLGGLWLLIRFVGNVDLKQAESYMFEYPEKFNYEPLAYKINQGHLHDEARHYTTSFDIGLALYKAASPEAQVFIREMVRMAMEDYIKGSFLHFPEMLELNRKGDVCTVLVLGRQTLEMALCHPEFADKQVNIDDLFTSWEEMEWRYVLPPFGGGLLTQKRWSYIAQQFERIRQEMGFDYDAANLGNLLQRYQDILALEDLNEVFTLA